MKKLQIAVMASTLLLASGASYAAPDLLVDRGLPTQNLNNQAGASRSNVSWSAQSALWFTGDDFQLGSTGGSWQITSLRTWVVGYSANGNANLADDSFLGDFYKGVALYLGNANGNTLDRVALAGLQGAGSDATSSPTVTATRVQYAGGLDYGGSQHDWAVVQLDFNNLNLSFASDAVVQFGVQLDEGINGWGAFNHASNAALSGSPQQGADGKYRFFESNSLMDAQATYRGSDCSGSVADGCFSPWDKVSDINVQVFGNAVPEPGTMALAWLALGALGLQRRRKA